MAEITSIIISIMSLFISIIVLLNSWWKSRPKIKIDQLYDSAKSIFVKKIDGNLKVTAEENRYTPKFVSVLLVDIIITNKSSEAISILEFSIPTFPVFNSYSNTMDSFEVSVKENSRIGMGQDQPIKYLKPEFTINPYTSMRGYIFFWSGVEQNVDIKKPILLTIHTSRKKFKILIKINEAY